VRRIMANGLTFEVNITYIPCHLKQISFKIYFWGFANVG